MDEYSENKKVWLDKINELAYEGRFEDAAQLITDGVNKKKYKLSKKDASEILQSCGIDVRYWFIKPLLDMGGEFPNHMVKYAKGILEGEFPDIKALQLVVESAKNKKIKQNGDSNMYYYKYLKYKTKYLDLKENRNKNKILKYHRYLIFAGIQYYTQGGWEDYYGAANSLDDAKDIYYEVLEKSSNLIPDEDYDWEKNPKGYYDWIHVVDTANDTIILNSWPTHGLLINWSDGK